MSIARTLPPCLGAALLSIASVAVAQDELRTTQLGDFFGIRTVEVAIDGRTHTFLLDTGGGVTTISPALSEAAGCRPWAQISGHRMTGERVTMPRCDDLAIEIGDRPFVVPNAGVFDLSPLLPPGSRAIDGLIGLDILAAQPFTLELAAGRLTFESPRSLAERTRAATEIPVRLERQAGGISLTVMVPVTTTAGTLWMQLDSGSDAAVQVAPTSAAPLG
ncbi:MAG: aspartyl protease family protein, partial [Brevundimonas sp.]